MGIVVIGATFVDIKGFPFDTYLANGRNAGYVEYIHGGVSRNVVEDIANVELRPTFLSVVDESALADDVLRQLEKHKVDTSYIRRIPGGMGTWLAVFDEKGDVAGSISVRPDLSSIQQVLDQQGDEIVSGCDALVLEADMDRQILKRAFRLAEKYGKKTYSIVSNMSICLERRDLVRQFDCFICNQQEAGLFFYQDFEQMSPEEIVDIVTEKIRESGIRQMVVTLGGDGAVYVDEQGNKGVVPAARVTVKDTTGCGDAFCAGVVMGLTYGRNLEGAVEVGTRLAAAVITSQENVCPRFMPAQLGLKADL